MTKKKSENEDNFGEAQGQKKGKKHQAENLQGTITIDPAIVKNGDPYPTVCVEGFPVNTFVNVLVPELSYGFRIMIEAKQCHTPTNILIDLDSGIYEVQSDVFDLLPTDTTPSNGRSGPTVTFEVE